MEKAPDSIDLLLNEEFETEMEMENENKSTNDQTGEEGENVDENDCDDLETGEEDVALPYQKIVKKEFDDFISEIKTRRGGRFTPPDNCNFFATNENLLSDMDDKTKDGQTIEVS